VFTLLVSVSSYSQTLQNNDSTSVKKDSTRLKYNFTHLQNGGLFLNSLAKKTILFDKVLNQYVIVEKIGDYDVRTPIYLTPKEYEKYRLQRDMLEYFKEKVSATNGKKKGG
jgi:hypothetical protein